MYLQTQPNKWSCLPTALANALRDDVRIYWDYLGHDGSEIVWPELPEPQCRRGFHIQEMVDLAYKLGRLLVPIEMESLVQKDVTQAWMDLGNEIQSLVVNGGDGKRLTDLYLNMGRLIVPFPRMTPIEFYFGKHDGILLGKGSRGRSHAAAWNHKEQLVYDPCGEKYTLDHFKVTEFWTIHDRE